MSENQLETKREVRKRLYALQKQMAESGCSSAVWLDGETWQVFIATDYNLVLDAAAEALDRGFKPYVQPGK